MALISNRLGASALMQGLADGYFVIPYTIGGYLAGTVLPEVNEAHPAFEDSTKLVNEGIDKLLSVKGGRTVDDFHKELGHILWEYGGMSRNETDMLKAKELIPVLREQFWENVMVTGSPGEFNQTLERAGRVADFLEFAELLVEDGVSREESCGCHFNEAFQTEEHEAQRDDDSCSYVAAWEFRGTGKAPTLHKEPLVFENVELAQRSYK